MRSRRAALAGMAVAAALGTVAAGARAATHDLSGLHDARYCELIEVRGAPSTAVATVWNTIGLNACPAVRWQALDPARLASELGDAFVVLNGPRHFVVDAASAHTGGVRAFGGLRMTKVATIPLRSAADVSQAPYADRTIRRRNSWRWKKGRTVFELVAPGGDTYVMQSYAQTVDPTLALARLGSLGRRLEPPPGWRYRTRRLRHALVLNAHGAATVVQDELQNTYQLATTTRRGRRVRHAVSLTGRTRTVAATTAGTVEDRGTVTGTPFGKGRIVLAGRLVNGRVTGTYTLTFPHGSVTGTVSMPFTISGNRISFRGTSRFTAGTGAYRGISSGELRVEDRNTLDGQSGTLSVRGSATY